MFRNAPTQMEAIFESVSDGIAVQDRNLKWVYANSAAARLCGYSSAEEFIQTPVEECLSRYQLLNEKGQPFSYDQLPARRIFRGEHPPVEAIIGVRDAKTGEESWSISRAFPIPDENGQPKYAVSLFRDISASRKDEDQLRLHSCVLEHMREGVLISNDRGMITYTNPTADRMFGYEDGELIGKHARILNAYAPAENEARVQAALGELKAKGSWSGEWKNVRKDGTTFYSRSQISALTLNDKMHFICVQEDITEERQTRDLARANELRFRALAQSMPQLIWTANLQGQIETVNDNYIDYTRIAAASGGTAEDWVNVIHPKDADHVLRQWKHSVETGDAFECEYRIRRYNGEYRWFLGRAAPLHSENGETTGWVGTATDIDDQKVAEADQRFLADTSSILGSSLDFKTRLQSAANLAVKRFGGWCTVAIAKSSGVLEIQNLAHADPQKLQRAWEIVAKYPPKPESSALYKVLRTGESVFIRQYTPRDLERAAYDGDHLRALRDLEMKSAFMTPLRDSSEVFGVLNLTSTDRLLTEKDLKLLEEFSSRLSIALTNSRLYEGAKAAIRARDDLLSVTSHELKTPITTLKLQLQIAQRLLRGADDGTSKEKIAKTIEGSIRQVNRLTNLIENLLDFSRQSDGKIQFQFERIDLSELMHETLDRLSEQIRASRSRFTSNIAPGVTVDADPLRIDQVIVNLVTNALKYGERSPIDVSLQCNDRAAIIEVRDHGMGIPKEMQERIFERFERGVSNRNISGFGLGLFITKQIVDAHHGRISVRSAPESGAAFRVEIPRNPNIHLDA